MSETCNKCTHKDEVQIWVPCNKACNERIRAGEITWEQYYRAREFKEFYDNSFLGLRGWITERKFVERIIELIEEKQKIEKDLAIANKMIKILAYNCEIGVDNFEKEAQEYIEFARNEAIKDLEKNK